jgi:hypothetical protein
MKKLSDKYAAEKAKFQSELSKFAQSLETQVTVDGDWTLKGFIDIFRNIYPISSDTKVISKILELHLFPHFLEFANRINYSLELATHQNWYPDFTFTSKNNPKIKFAVDLKTTYVDEKRTGFCHGFTLGSHGEYFINRDSLKNIQYPYNEYSGHFCFGIIYSRRVLTNGFEMSKYSLDELEGIPSVINRFTFFAEKNGKLPAIRAGAEIQLILAV